MASEREHAVSNDYDNLSSQKSGDRDLRKSATYTNPAFDDNVTATPPTETRDSSDLVKYKKFAIASLVMSSFSFAAFGVILAIIVATGDIRHTGNEPGTLASDEALTLEQIREDVAKEDGEREARHEGDSGGLGLVGLKGVKGEPGLPGLCLKGEPGVVGIKGNKGDAGNPESMGPQGPRGDSGLGGLDGMKGDPGERGAPGLPGQDGLPGSNGLNGTGVQGERGPSGAPGLRGDDGVPGIKGQKGNAGQKGAKGASDASCCSIRLAGGTINYGRIEVRLGASWGTVCDDDFDGNDAIVACRQLGFSSGSVLAAGSVLNGSLPIALDDLRCTGTERLLQLCVHKGAWNHNCQHFEDVGVSCY